MNSQMSHQHQGLKLLDGKVAVVYGAGGGVGSAVAKAFAREGATVYLTGRTRSSLDAVAREISKTNGTAKFAEVDALDQRSVEAHLHDITADAGKLDISFNLIGTSVAMGKRLSDLSEERFGNAAFDKVRSNFITMTAAARLMEKTRQGGHPRANSSCRTFAETQPGWLCDWRRGNRVSLQTARFRGRS